METGDLIMLRKAGLLRVFRERVRTGLKDQHGVPRKREAGGDNAAPRARTHYDVFELFAGIPAHQKVFRNSISASLSASARFVPK